MRESGLITANLIIATIFIGVAGIARPVTEKAGRTAAVVAEVFFAAEARLAVCVRTTFGGNTAIAVKRVAAIVIGGARAALAGRAIRIGRAFVAAAGAAKTMQITFVTIGVGLAGLLLVRRQKLFEWRSTARGGARTLRRWGEGPSVASTRATSTAATSTAAISTAAISAAAISAAAISAAVARSAVTRSAVTGAASDGIARTSGAISRATGARASVRCFGVLSCATNTQQSQQQRR
jgi:hypothetical protein